MSFKSSLEALFKLSGGQAMPGAEVIQFTQQIDPDSTWDYIAPENGYITISCPPAFMWISGRVQINGNFPDKFSTAPFNGNYPCFTFACKKGQTIQVAVGASNSSSDSKEIYIRFIATVGSS